jgi:hypothetical protein
MLLWSEDLMYYVARGMRAAGIALAAVAWVSVLASEVQQTGDLRSYALVGAATLGVVVSHWFGRLPPSADVVEVLRPLERDIINAARERAGGDDERLTMLATRIAALAVVRVRRSGRVPRDRRAWFRGLARLAGMR